MMGSVNHEVDRIHSIVSYLIHSCGIDASRIMVEHYLVMSRGKAIGLCKNNPHNVLKNSGMLVNRPDIMIVDNSRSKIMLVIEVDGSIHYTDFARERTEKRNHNYKRNRVNYCIINVAQCCKNDRLWFEKIDKAVEKAKKFVEAEKNCKRWV